MRKVNDFSATQGRSLAHPGARTIKASTPRNKAGESLLNGMAMLSPTQIGERENKAGEKSNKKHRRLTIVKQSQESGEM